MNTSLSSEEGLELLVGRILENTDPDFTINLLRDEGVLFEVLSNLSYKGTPQLIVKLSFCIVLLLVNEWKRRASNKDLLPMFYNHFKVTGRFIHFAYTKPLAQPDLEVYSENLLEQSADASHLLLFVPDKFIKEKRLYRITREDIARINNSRSWQKLPDPHNCQSWIKLPIQYQTMKQNEQSKKLSRQILGGIDSTEESIAKKLIFRNNQSSKRSTILSDVPKSSLFKRRIDSEMRGGQKSLVLLSPVALSEDGLSPTFFNVDDLCKRIPTQISQTTKTTGNDSPGLVNDFEQFPGFTNFKKQFPIRSLNELEMVGDDTKPHGKIKRYTLVLGGKKLFPT